LPARTSHHTQPIDSGRLRGCAGHEVSFQL
jgi:hypothetical protein